MGPGPWVGEKKTREEKSHVLTCLLVFSLVKKGKF